MASYIFCIDEIGDNDNLRPAAAYQPTEWKPTNPSICVGGGATGMYWYCDGRKIRQVAGLPNDSRPYKTFSMFYRAGRGFWVMRGDATKNSSDVWEPWRPLCFNYTGPASSLTNAGEYDTVQYSRKDQTWRHALLPDIYHGKLTTNPTKGALCGDLAIFLGLIAMSINQENLAGWLPAMMVSSRFQVPPTPERKDKRGVVVHVHTCPSWNPLSSEAHLRALEEGHGGCYYQ
ncbi:hypothetical protein EJ07DRAFT_152310 [Lizonia empirigonia]|nr:hypothetical protein EJ07DRAFT_152310 [Lizonia empirigonia]